VRLPKNAVSGLDSGWCPAVDGRHQAAGGDVSVEEPKHMPSTTLEVNQGQRHDEESRHRLLQTRR